MSEPNHDPSQYPEGASESEHQSNASPDGLSGGANHEARHPPDSPRAEPPQDREQSEPHSSQESPVESMPPQRIPPLPRSQFTRYLLDYVGGGQYQLSIQGEGEGIIPFAKADSPAPLMAIANETSLPGDEFIVAPAVALVDIACMNTGAIRLLQSKGHDPFGRIGNALMKRPKDQVQEAMRELEEAESTDAGNGQDSSGSAALDEGGEPAQGRINGVDPAELAPELRQMLEHDRRTGGRLGWIFDVDRAGDGDDGAEPGDGRDDGSHGGGGPAGRDDPGRN